MDQELAFQSSSQIRIKYVVRTGNILLDRSLAQEVVAIALTQTTAGRSILNDHIVVIDYNHINNGRNRMKQLLIAGLMTISAGASAGFLDGFKVAYGSSSLNAKYAMEEATNNISCLSGKSFVISTNLIAKSDFSAFQATILYKCV